MPKIDFTPSPYFGVPTALVDEFLKEADEKKLKILLYILRHAPRAVTVEELCRASGASVSATELIVEYWKESGVLGGVVAEPKSAPAPSRKKPDAVEVAKAAETDETLSFLLKRAQELMGRTLTRSETEALFSVYSWAGVPADAFLLMLQYCVSIGKGNMRYVEKLAYSWQDEGVSTYEEAERKINELKAADKAEAKVKSVVGIEGRNLTTSEKEHLRRWINEWGFGWDLITAAFERTAEKTGKASFAYMNGILKKWRELGIKKKKDLDKEQAKPAKAAANRSFSEADVKAYEEWGRKKLKEANEK
ncbi:MAG: DnaD domain protein [Clostridia bacterium]|nr:DnaD domain protein [Clostridia bacterium]